MSITHISKNKIKIYSSLQKKKFRESENLFVVEGKKMVNEAIYNFPDKIEAILYTGNSIPDIPTSLLDKTERINYETINKISALKTPPPILAVLNKPTNKLPENYTFNKTVLVLDNISDPGNLGTIIRLADWFGVNEVVCSNQSVDSYNPKVIQASMGSIFRVKVFYTPLEAFILSKKNKGYAIIGTSLDGENIYENKISSPSLIILGNESTGISESVKKLVTQNLLIPSFSKKNSTSESLNVSTATAIVLAETRRQENYSK